MKGELRGWGGRVGRGQGEVTRGGGVGHSGGLDNTPESEFRGNGWKRVSA